MKQIVQHLDSGKTQLEEVPVPQVTPGAVLIKTTKSLVSLGTERMLVEFGKSSLIQKARQQPEKVRQVLDKMKSDGILPTIEAVFNKLGQPIPLGYCNVGVIEEVGDEVRGFRKGDRVVSNGPHAEYVCVGQNMVARIPDNVSDEHAAFTVVGAIGLQGMRLMRPELGETVVVVGLGLIGLITAQLLKANGCRVIGIDPDSYKLAIAAQKDILTLDPAMSDPVAAVLKHTNDVGADAVIITASAKSNAVISQAARMSRKRGRIVLVGVVGLELNRSEFYEKELSFQVSCSYGPGRYDPQYEEKGVDYPIGFVRWTEQRNFEAVLQSMSSGALDVGPLISGVVDLHDFQRIYNGMGGVDAIGMLLRYPGTAESSSKVVSVHESDFKGGKACLAVVGAGNFTRMTLLPAMAACRITPRYICSEGGLNGTTLARKYKVPYSTTEYAAILKDSDVDAVVITTRHNKHAEMTIAALGNGKHVFVEKPLAITEEQLNEVGVALKETDRMLHVGFNRRFSAHARKVREILPQGQLKTIIATMNAGFIPGDSWIQDMEVGGGRIIGEACHLIDLCTFWSGSTIREVCMNALGTSPSVDTDNALITLRYENGDQATIHYLSNGNKRYSKERFEIYSGGATVVLDNFRRTKAYGVKGFNKLVTKQDKGHKAQLQAFVDRVKAGGQPLIPAAELLNTTRATFAALQSLKKHRWVSVETVDVQA